MKVKFIKDFPSNEGTKSTKEKGQFYPAGEVVDLRVVNAMTAIEGKFAEEFKEVKEKK